jgi:signal transduction histidine kinase
MSRFVHLSFVAPSLSHTLQAKQKNVSLNFKGPSQIPSRFSRINVSVDINRFGQVIRNIISNALKFTPSGGVISIAASEIRNPGLASSGATVDLSEEEHRASVDLEAGLVTSRHQNVLRIDISDTGPGITKEQQKSLLKEVVQFHDPLSSNVNGAGLGLWSM